MIGVVAGQRIIGASKAFLLIAGSSVYCSPSG
jgi:hypothetical protein